MLIKRTSQLSGKTRELEIDVTEKQLRAWQAGGLIQNVMPHLSASDREFLITGSTEEDWNEAFGPEE